MKIGVALTSFYPATDYGGPVAVARQHLDSLQQLTPLEPLVMCSNVLEVADRKYLPLDTTREAQGVKYYRSLALTRKFTGIVSLELLVKNLSAVRQCEVVHIHFAREFVPVMVALQCLLARKPFVVQTHGMVVRKPGLFARVLDRLVIAPILSRASKVLYLQAEERKELQHYTRGNLHELPNGIELGPQASTPKTPEYNFLFLARLHPRKRVLRFIELIEGLWKQDNRVRARIVGPDGGDLAAALQKIEALGLQKVIEVCGPANRQQVAEHLAWTDFYLLPSLNEPFPMTVLEAFAHRRVVVACETVQIRKMLIRHDAALLIQQNNPEAVAQILDLMHNVKRRAELIENGHRLVQEELSSRKIGEKLLTVYRSVVHG